MRLRVLQYWDRLRASFWFLPTLLALAAIALAFAAVALDDSLASSTAPAALSWVYSGGADGARGVLETIAGSMITIAGVVFSLTLIALSLASSQFGPRLVRNYMDDRTNQVVLGTFVATFLYCLLVLRTIQRADGTVPHLSVTLGVLLAVASLGLLIYFIHHVAVSIQADAVIARVGAEMGAGIERLFPQEIGDAPPRAGSAPGEVPGDFARESIPIASQIDGYVQFVDIDELIEIAGERDALIHVERRPGHYVSRGTPLVSVWPGGRRSDDVDRRTRDAFVLGPQRTPSQDVEFAVLQLVEIAVRALSPGVNDPFTAIACIDRLGSGLVRLAQREIPSAFHRDKAGRLRVIAKPVDFRGVVDAAFDQIRQNARASVAVTIRLLETIAVVARAARRPGDRDALHRQAEMIVRQARAHTHAPEDLAEVEQRYRAAVAALQRAAAS